MLRTLLMGTAAGAVGTVALNITTYADMVIRGRPSSDTPTQVAGKLTDKAGLGLAAKAEDDEQAQNRLSGAGSLLGYVTGLGVGTVYGAFHLGAGKVPLPLAALGLAATAMAGSDVPTAAFGVSDPSTWPASSWAADIVPHLVYGIATALAFDAFTNR